ncbi:hypothetical protein [Terrimonas sp.]|uniref:hypothetical protein n=1 Tax=Terrimonas sp. TaxID=1914338 RepID=UPI00105745F2|nr:hypothetical protein [Terrimonas sp.]
MKLTNRQLILGSLQPLLFCIGMYCVVLVFSVFVCSSLYHAIKGGKKVESVENTTTASLSNIKVSNNSTLAKQ